MATCPECMRCYPDATKRCADDGTALLPDEACRAFADELRAGERVGDYEIERKIGQGAYGKVYAAAHPVIGKRAAIKVLGKQFSSNPKVVSRFVAEARAVNQIRHRNIIDVFDFGTLDSGQQYLVMELLDGMSLDRYLKQRGRLSPEEAIPILRDIGRALDAAHAAGVAHRDLKPENVFVSFDEDGCCYPKLLDFGIAKLMGDEAIEHQTRTGAMMGTPAYMSPEQCRGKGVDHRTDLYAFGVLAHEILTGKRPFVGDSSMDLMFKHAKEEPPAMSSECAAVPPELDGPVLALLAKDPANRPPSLAVAVEALTEAAGAAGFEVLRATRTGSLGASGERVQSDEAVTALTASGGKETATIGAVEADVAVARGRAGRGRLAGAGAAVLLAAVGVWWFAGRGGQGETGTASRPVGSVRAVATSAAGAASAAASASARIDVSVQGNVDGIVVLRDGKPIGGSATPFQLARSDKSVALLLRKPGYDDMVIQVTPTEALRLEVELQPVASASVSAKPGPARSAAGRHRHATRKPTSGKPSSGGPAHGKAEPSVPDDLATPF